MRSAPSQARHGEPRQAPAAGSRRAAGAAAALLLASCASLEIERQTQTSGTFHSSGVAFTILSKDVPRSALDIARENAADARLTNLEVESTRVVPYLGPFDWLLDILGVRYASISGTWGSSGE